MNSVQILKAATKYKILIDAQGVKAQRQDTSSTEKPTAEQSWAHSAWMLEAIAVQLLEGNEQKAERWLCFVQGVLWMTGIATIDSMRDDNR